MNDDSKEKRKNCKNTECLEKNPQNEKEFFRSSKSKDGLNSWCKSCYYKYQKEYKKISKNRIKVNLYAKKRYQEKKLINKENKARYAHKYYLKNKDKIKTKVSKYKSKNLDKVLALNLKRKAQQILATPPWLTKDHYEQILNFYSLAKELSWLSESPLEVDHIIPLNGKNVRGLHVPWNLQILPKNLNLKKSNKLES